MESASAPVLTKKVNTVLKNDLNALDKVAKQALINSERLKSPHTVTSKPFKVLSAVPKKNLQVPSPTPVKRPNKSPVLATTSNRKHLKPLVNTPTVDPRVLKPRQRIEYEDIPTHKYPFNSEKIVFVEDIRSKVYKGTTGVIPVRHSQALEELNFILKGKLIVARKENENEREPNDDDFISDGKPFNTPINSIAFAEYGNNNIVNSKTVPPEEVDPKLAVFYNDHNKELPKTKPAILNATGTLGRATFSERPKPEKKQRILPKLLSKESTFDEEYVMNKWKVLIKNPRISMQIEKDEDAKSLLEEIRDSDSENALLSMRQFVRRMSNRSNEDTEINQNVNDMWSLLNTRRDIGDKETRRKKTSGVLVKESPRSSYKDEKSSFVNMSVGTRRISYIEPKSLISVETLITAIKSGELVKEQQDSNQRIQEILLSILDEKTLSMFDDLFKDDKSKNDTIEEEDYEERMDAIDEVTEKEESTMPNSNVLPSQQTVREASSNSFRLESARLPSGLFLESERAQTVDSMVSGYDVEMNEYLASLPLEVTNEDVLNVQAEKLEVLVKPEVKRESLLKTKEHMSKRHDLVQPTTEERYAKNLHLFCMVEHQRRTSLLLPDELVNVTRKLHARNRFDNFNQLTKSPSVSSLRRSSINHLSRSTTKLDSESRYSYANDAAQRIFDNLEAESMSKTNEKDSGYGDDSSLENWRMVAEASIHEDFYLKGKKVKIRSPEPTSELALKFLRPAPAKMSIRPGYIKKNLFPEYKSIPPPDEDDFKQLDKVAGFQKRSIRLNGKSTRTDTNDEEDSDEDNDVEGLIILEKLIGRKYGSETALSKRDVEDLFNKEDVALAETSTELEEEKSLWGVLAKGCEKVFKKSRTLSDSVIYSKPAYKENSVVEDSEGVLKIDSNYSEAIEEALNQKGRIKKNYSNISDKLKLLGNTDNLKLVNLSVKSESKKAEDTSDSGDEEFFNITARENSAMHKYFPKTTPEPEIVQVGGKKSHKKKLIRKKKGDKPVDQNSKALNSDILRKVRNEILQLNVKQLTRCQSMDTIKFPKKILHPDDLLVRVPKKVKLGFWRNGSKPCLLNFEEYKAKHSFQNDVAAEMYDEREWVRGVWEAWFEEVIPQLDGTGGRPSSSLSNEKDSVSDGNRTNIKGSSFVNTPANETTINDDDDGDEKKQNAVSPTPYATYDQVDLEDESGLIDENGVKLLEKEIEKVTRYIEVVKPNAFDLARRGTLYRKLGLLSLALKDIQDAIDIESNFVDAYWQRHLIYLTQNKKAEALNDLAYILKLNRTHGGAYLSSGDLCAERNEVALAISHYTNAIKYDPNNYNAYYKRACLYEIRGDVRMAMDDYLTTSKLNPKIHEAWFKHGMYYYNNKNWDYAIVDFSELIRHNPKNQSLARLFRGKCYYNLEEYQWALDDFSVALHLNPNDWQAFYHRGCLLRLADPKQALQDLSCSLLLENGYDNLNSFLHRGILYTEFGRYDEAVKDFEDVLALDKEFAPAYVNLGIIYMNVKLNYWKAIKQFNLAIKSNPVYLRAYLCRAQAYRYIHDLKRAYIDYTKAIHLDPMNTQVYIYRGQVIFEMGDSKLASFCVQHAAFMENKESTIGFKEANEDRPTTGKTKSTTESNASNMNQSVTQRAVVFSFLKNFNKAINVLDYELKLKPSGEIYNLLGRVYMKAKRWPEAVSTFERSIEANIEEDDMKKGQNENETRFNYQELSDAYFLKGQSLLEMFKYQEAYNSFDKVISMHPQNAYAHYFRGCTRFHLNHSKCIQDFNKALLIDPNLFEAFLARACIYGIKGRFTKAILNCNQAIKLSPKSVRGYLYRGALKYLSLAHAYAIDDLTEALNLDQTCALAYFNRALCYQKLKQYKNALKDYSTVLMLGKYLEFKVFINRGLLYYQLNDYYNALGDMSQAALYEPDDHNIQHMIGVCLRKLKKYDDAVEVLTDIFSKNMDFHDALLSRGNTYVDFGTDEAFLKAQKDYEHVLLRNPKNLDAYVNLAYLFQMTGRFKLAWEQFTKAMEISKGFAPIYEGRSVVCLQMSNTDAALKDINQAIRIQKSAELFVNRGVIYQFMGDNINAMRDYQAAILLDPQYGLAYYNSANILLLHRQHNQAIENLNTAIDTCQMKDESTYQNRAIAKAFNDDASGAFRDLCEAIKYDKYSTHIYMNRALLLYKLENYKLAEKDLTTAISLSPNDALLYKLRADCRGKLEMKETAIQDYKTFMDLKQRDEFRENYSSFNMIKS